MRGGAFSVVPTLRFVNTKDLSSHRRPYHVVAGEISCDDKCPRCPHKHPPQARSSCQTKRPQLPPPTAAPSNSSVNNDPLIESKHMISHEQHRVTLR